VKERSAPSSPGRFEALVRGAGPSLVFNAVLPWLTYLALTTRGVETVPALAASSVFPIAGTLIGWLRSGRPDITGLLSALFIALSVAIALATDNPLVVLLRGSVANGVFAILCFGSLLLARPLLFYIGRQFVAGWNRDAFAQFDAQWQQPTFRRTMRQLTVAWGCWFVVQAVGRVLAVQMLPISTYLGSWPIVANLGTIAMISWSMSYAQRGPGLRRWDPAEHGARLSDEARRALDRADEEATRLRHGYVGTEHLVLALCAGDGLAARTLAGYGVTLGAARATLEVSVLPGNASPLRARGYTPRLQDALRRADDVCRAAGAGEIGTEHLLLGLADERAGQSAILLQSMGVDLAGLRERLVGGGNPTP
jgi:hypothetical protein